MTALRHLASGRYSRRITRQNLALLAGATALGLWVGAGAPNTSPVSPTAIASVNASLDTPVAAAPVAPAPVADHPHHHGGGR